VPDCEVWPRAGDMPKRAVVVREAQPAAQPGNPIAARAMDWDGFRAQLDSSYGRTGQARRAHAAPPMHGRRTRASRAAAWSPSGAQALIALAVLGVLLLASQALTAGGGDLALTRFYGSAAANITVSGAAATLGGEVAPLALGEGATAAFLPLPGEGPFRLNVVSALEANNGALQRVVIPPGGAWSFNRAVGNPGVLTLATIAGVYGGGWCDLASRYVVALRPLLPPEALEFVRHRDATGISLAGVSDDDGVAIWNTNDRGGEQDLIIRNPSNRTLVISARLDAEGVEVRAAFQ
jgi:hypothetical protein